MSDVPQPNWAELEGASAPGWISWTGTTSGSRGRAARLMLLPLYPLLRAAEAISTLLGSEVMANARAVGRASRLERDGRFAEAMRTYLDECARLEDHKRQAWASSYWHTLSFAARCSLETDASEKDLFLAEVTEAPEPFQGRFAAETAECVSRIKRERQLNAEAEHWANVAVEADPTHPGPRRWKSWLTSEKSD